MSDEEMYVFKLEDEKMTDFSKSKVADLIKIRICADCQIVHMSLHDEEGNIFAHVDLVEPSTIQSLIDALGEQKKAFEIYLEKKDELSIPNDT